MEAAFNEREAVRRLKRARFDEEQSDAVVEIVGDARAGLATNADIRELKATIQNLRLIVLVVGALIAFAPDIRGAVAAVAAAIGGA